tara:strand:+ start:343 stop:1239 length:897 start_codon:yes stop_codon:yes gene_type:complete
MKKEFSKSNFLIVGLANNCENMINEEVKIIHNAFQGAASVDWLIIESDSDDATVNILDNLSNELSIRYITLGQLKKKYIKRTERISVCRNYYLDEIKNNPKYKEIDFIVVVDLDGVNSKLTTASVQSCWKTDVDWDACFANQSKPYYDIWSLRHKIWSPDDCWQSSNFYKDNGVTKFEANYAAVWSRMIRIDKATQPILVESAFGGIGIYKKNIIINSRYEGLNSKSEECCEHVNFHKHLCDMGYKLYIIPSFINCGWNEHNSYLKLNVRLRKLLFQEFNNFISSIGFLKSLFEKKNR